MDRSSEPKPDKGWRGTPELWLDAAYDLLVESGVEAVKVMPLAARLGLSRTSFYWHFPDREALLAGLIARWESRNTAQILARTEAPSATIAEAMLAIIDLWITPALFDSRLEFAIRTWALTDPALAETLRQTDETRTDAIAALFRRHGFPPREAETRARALYLTQVGYISMRTEEKREVRLARIPDYVLIFSGQAPSPAELQTFHARHKC
jgi:AcrR family transcriptional regulator